MTSLRKRKKQADDLGMSTTELELVELLHEVLESLRWTQVLGYSNQFLLQQKLKVDAPERDKILAAAARMVDKDQKLHEWRDRLGRLKGELVQKKRDFARSKKALEGEREAGADQG